MISSTVRLKVLIFALVTALGEALYFRIAFGVDLLRVLGTDVMWSAGWRPAWVVLICTAAITAAVALRLWLDRRSRQRAAVAATAAE